jgi:hypothetical protein
MAPVRLLLAACLLLTALQPAAPAQGRETPASGDPATVGDAAGATLELADPATWPEIGRREVGYLNGRFLILNMHGALFHPDPANLYENIEYARWMNAGVIRVFATDAGGFTEWDGERLGNRIADLAPALRGANLKLIVAIVNNHEPVPNERPESFGWMDDYHQLLLPFYTDHWRGAYLEHLRAIIGATVRRGAADVVWAWELGNELHTPRRPAAVLPFINAAAREVRALDPGARILAGTMGANHLEPGVPDSAVARALYCHGPISAYTLHTYDWVSRDRWGDMPIHWDFEHITNEPCPNGRELPILVEELGTSRALPGVYEAWDEAGRFAQEVNQIRMVLSYPGVVAIGAWSAESMYVHDISRFDNRRGLTSYGDNRLGGGTCFRLREGEPYGARCMLERIYQALPKVPEMPLGARSPT